MRKLFEQVTDGLRAFIAQRDDVALVVESPAAQGALLTQLLESLEEAITSAMFWKFAVPFTTGTAYAGAVVDSFAARQELGRLLLEKEGKFWPPLPDEVKDPAAPPAQRLRAAMVFARSLMPAQEGATLVWVMFPAEISDGPAYAALMDEVLGHEFPFPWCHHMRILLRDDPATGHLKRALARAPRVAWYAPDLSPPALERAVADEAADETLPMDERVQGLLMTAALDYTHKRYDQALDKYQRLFDYYAYHKDRPLMALALNGMGEVLQAMGQGAEAVTCFEAALVPASEGDPPPVPMLLNVSLNLAQVRMQVGRYEEAEGYFDIVQKLAAAMRNPELRIAVIENLGQAQYLQGKIPAALETWKAGATLAEKLDKPELRKGLLERARAHYAKAGDRAGQAEVERQLAAAGAAARA
jgi:hypothetical protein